MFNNWSPKPTQPSDFLKWFEQFDSTEQAILATFIYMDWLEQKADNARVLKGLEQFHIHLRAEQHAVLYTMISRN